MSKMVQQYRERACTAEADAVGSKKALASTQHQASPSVSMNRLLSKLGHPPGYSARGEAEFECIHDMQGPAGTQQQGEGTPGVKR